MMIKKWLGAAFMAVVLSVGFTSCSSDDDLGSDEEITASLVGTWEATTHRGWDEEDGVKEPDDWDYEAGELVFEIYKDGTGKEIWDGNSEDNFTWTVKDKELSIRYDYDYTQKYDIVKLTSSQLVIEQTYKDEYGTYYEKITLKKK